MQLRKNINKNLLTEQSFPTYDIEKKQNCILHFGVGNFHRAHQALYIHELLENNQNISIIGVNLRSDETKLKLVKQDYLYTLVRISKDLKEIKILNPIKKILFGRKDKIEIRNLIASKDIKLITLTVTEKGYHFDKDKKLNYTADIINDLEDRNLNTVIGHISFGLIHRFKLNKEKIIILSCDNLSENGNILKNLIYEFLNKIYPECLNWFLSNVEFPLSMIDGIVPNNNKHPNFFSIPYEDNSIVVTEPYRDWYIQSDNVDLRRLLNNKKISFVNDVSFYENIKLKILNGAHSSLAYIGTLLGYTYVHEAIEDKICYNFISNFLNNEVLSILKKNEDFDILSYKNDVLSRFKNPYIEDKLIRIAMDGSLKIPIRLLDTYKLNKNKTPYINAIITSWILFLIHMIENEKNNLSDFNKELLINIYESDKENFVENLFNDKNIFNLNEYQKSSLVNNINHNIRLIKKITFSNFIKNF